MAKAKRLPNLLTGARLLLSPFVPLVFFLLPGGAHLALALFLIAAATDALDGWLARHLDARSALGARLDPLADKALIAGALLVVVPAGAVTGIHLVAVALIVMREAAVTLARLVDPARYRRPLPAAQVKTAVQMAALAALLASLALPPGAGAAVQWAGLGLLWLAAGLSLTSALAYLRSPPRKSDLESGQ